MRGKWKGKETQWKQAKKMFVKRVDLLLFQQGKNRAALSRDLDICLTNMQYAKVSDRKKVEAVAILPKLTDTHED